MWYAKARYYNSDLGRFAAEDPLKGTIGDIQSLNLYPYVVNNPLKYVDLDGRAKNSICFKDLFDIKPEDMTRAIAEYLIANPAAVYATQNGWFKDLFYAAGFTRDADGIYHARQSWSIQSFKFAGYNNFYDTVFHYATSMNKVKFEFSSGGENYVFWAWKGDYLNLEAGAEMGIYRRMVINGTPTDHWLVDKSLAVPMNLSVDYQGKNIITYVPEWDDPQIFDPLRKSTDKWWITGFNPNYQDVKASQLTATYTVDFSGKEGMYNAFYSIWKKDDRWKFNSKTYKATFTF
jgi:hypothetical protein